MFGNKNQPYINLEGAFIISGTIAGVSGTASLWSSEFSSSSSRLSSASGVHCRSFSSSSITAVRLFLFRSWMIGGESKSRESLISSDKSKRGKSLSDCASILVTAVTFIFLVFSNLNYHQSFTQTSMLNIFLRSHGDLNN
ncbi:hypothetical protein BC830DRAFT_1109938 [Chytriomyces sp. MP71]|nr:hypothetical protein BC830DRAFT_1109938 [Chytriomyces sp. MP71]